MNAQTDIQESAATAAGWFATKLRDESDEDSRYVVLKDGAPGWVKELVHTAHGEFMPDDWRYRWTQAALEFIASGDHDDEYDDYTDSDAQSGFAEDQIDVYTGRRLEWLSSNLNRAGYCDEALENMGGEWFAEKGIVELIGVGQYEEAYEVYGLVVQSLQDVPNQEA